MKPLQIGLLVVAGALGGAVVMKVWQRPQAAPVAAPVVAQVETPAPAAAAVPVPVPVPVEPPAPEAAPAHAPVSAAAVAWTPAAPSAIRTKRVAAVRPRRPPVVRSLPVVRSQPAVHTPEPVVVARSEPAPPVAAPAHASEQQQPPPPAPASAPVPVPPARTEPENVTPPPPPAEPEPEPPRVTLNAGMLIPVRLVDGLSSERNRPGDTFTATLYRELVADGFVIAERGARVEGRVVAADRGKSGSASTLSVELTRIHTSDGQDVAVETDSFERRSESGQMSNAEKIGGGAALGAIIGAVAGGGKGAAIGAGVGGGAGTGDVLLTRGRPATLPTETRITFRLRAPVTLTEKRS